MYSSSFANITVDALPPQSQFVMELPPRSQYIMELEARVDELERELKIIHDALFGEVMPVLLYIKQEEEEEDNEKAGQG